MAKNSQLIFQKLPPLPLLLPSRPPPPTTVPSSPSPYSPVLSLNPPLGTGYTHVGSVYLQVLVMTSRIEFLKEQFRVDGAPFGKVGWSSGWFDDRWKTARRRSTPARRHLLLIPPIPASNLPPSLRLLQDHDGRPRGGHGSSETGVIHPRKLSLESVDLSVFNNYCRLMIIYHIGT